MRIFAKEITTKTIKIMKTNETIYKTTNDNYRVKIWDVIDKEWIYLGTEKGLDNALIKLREAQVEYYKEKIYLLPKCISIDFNKNVFCFCFYYNKKTIKKQCTTLESAINEKQNFILKLM
tara:strand:- start:4019 stop:4378 length:360 start_codon:yes stop_codon:yes gene_type:complete